MTYKLLLLDVDGTIVASKEHALPTQQVVDAIRHASEHVTVALATGRPLDFARPVIEALGLTGPGIFNGGAEIIEMHSGKVLQSQNLEVTTLQELVRLALPFGYQVYVDGDQYSNPLKTAADVLEPCAKLFIEAVSTHDAIHMLEQLNGVPGAEAHPTTSWNEGDVVDIHITHEHATKRHGAEQLISLLGLAKDEVIAVGDGHNDVPLLEAAGLKVAMGNAPDEVKQLADYVAPTLDENGVAEVIKKYILQ